MNFTGIFSYFSTRMYSYVFAMYPYVTRMLLVCHPYVLVGCLSHNRCDYHDFESVSCQR